MRIDVDLEVPFDLVPGPEFLVFNVIPDPPFRDVLEGASLGRSDGPVRVELECGFFCIGK
jgi:hypothetical protein